MVIVRESPRAKLSPDKNMTLWPPQSPIQALLSSPSGRRKWQDRRSNRDEERSPSPSPVRKRLSGSKVLQALSVPSDQEDEDEDEETLQLKLAQIQAKLKLKKLQGKKARQTGGAGDVDKEDSQTSSASRTDSVTTSSGKLLKMSASHPRFRQPSVEVPLSPAKDRLRVQDPVSPARVRLGLDGFRAAADVSLKRPRDGTQLARSSSTRSGREEAAVIPRSSFNQRLTQSKLSQHDQQAKDERIKQSRSKRFGTLGSSAFDPPAPKPSTGSRTTHLDETERMPPPSSSRKSRAEASSTAMRSTISTSTPSYSSSTRPAHSSKAASIRSLSPHKGAGPATEPPRQTSPMSDSDLDLQDAPSSSYESYSSTHLSKRHIPHLDLARALQDKELYTLPRLLKEVKAPHYDPPDCESDFVVFATVSSKSSPFNQKQTHRTSDETSPQEDAEKPRNKFMVLHLTDLKWEVDCFLFGTAFDQFWKLTPGTLLAILNPAIMPPKTNQHSGKFCLKLGSSEDCVMEIGVARDLGYCVSVKKNGEQCGQWIDKRKTEVCEFHVNVLIEKSRKGRMEVNTMWRSHNGSGGGEGAKRASHGGGRGGMFGSVKRKKLEDGLGHAEQVYDREYGQLYGVSSHTTTSLLDEADVDALHGMSRAEASRKRIAGQQRERDTARRLAEIGNGMGAEYLRSEHPSASAASGKRSADLGFEEARRLFDKPSASSLGLLSNKATDAHLSPAKDGRKRAFGSAAMSSRGPEAMGWKGATKPGLLMSKADKMGSPERGQTRLDSAVRRPDAAAGRADAPHSSRSRSKSPIKKKAKFHIEGKGIREPGRESLGDELLAAKGGVDEEDDLDII